MIEPQHLRIGNVITMYVKESPAISSIHLVEPTTLMMIDGSIQSRGMAFRPISLTEEILLKVGFVFNGHDWKYKSFTIVLIDGFVNFYVDWIEYEEPIRQYESCFCFLHNIQNLIFNLTGQELNTSGLI